MTKYLKQFELTVQYEEYINSDIAVLPNVSVTNDDNKVHYNPIPNYLRFTAIEDSVIKLGTYNIIDEEFTGETPIVNLEYSINGVNFQQWNYETQLYAGQTLYFRGNNPSTFGGSEITYSFGESTGKFECHGNIMSLLYQNDFEGKLTIPYEDCFANIFDGCIGLTTAPELPATTLADHCYDRMFYGCTSLITAPVLPATTLAVGCYYSMFAYCTKLTTVPKLPATTLTHSCYYNMFYGCTSLTTVSVLPATTLAVGCYSSMFSDCTALTTAPKLPITKLANNCYEYMFFGCTGLTTAPELPATVLANYCYSNMFNGCTGLTTSPELPATTLAIYCYESMFLGCTNLTTAPKLPATTLANSCYKYMFLGCTNLTTAPKLPATALAHSCYYQMFRGCTNLTTAPELPATTLATQCYYYMFYGCTSLTTAPDLPATTLANYCYSYMFNGCKKLNSITCLATNISATNCTYNWVNGVASSGTFTKSKSMTSWKNGSSGIPTGWTVKDNQEIQRLRMWVDDFATDIDYNEGSRTVKMQLEINNPESEGANPYIYSGDTITYNGKTYYLWRADKGYENDIKLTRYFATSTVDFDELYAQSLEDNINNTFTSAIGMFDDNKEIYTAQGLIYDGTDAHYLVKIEKI